jgi:hypothetical protein
MVNSRIASRASLAIFKVALLDNSSGGADRHGITVSMSKSRVIIIPRPILGSPYQPIEVLKIKALSKTVKFL